MTITLDQYRRASTEYVQRVQQSPADALNEYERARTARRTPAGE